MSLYQSNVKTSLVTLDQTIRYHLRSSSVPKEVRLPISVGRVPVRSLLSKTKANNRICNEFISKQCKDEFG